MKHLLYKLFKKLFVEEIFRDLYDCLGGYGYDFIGVSNSCGNEVSMSKKTFEDNFKK